LAVIEHRAASSIGTLFTNPGGPGGSGIDQIRNNLQYWPALARNFDMVSFDPRGSGRSEPVDCLNDHQMDDFFQLQPVPTSKTSLERVIAAARSYVHACRANTGKVLGFVDGLDQARDIDSLRKALGGGKLSYLGLSYGTYLGSVYASRFGSHLRAAVLDGDVPPDESPYDFIAGQAKGFEQNLKLFLSYCRQTSSCPFRAHSGSEQPILDLLARLDRDPLAVGSRSLTADEASYALGASLYGKQGWPYLAQALASAEKGDGRGLLQGFDNYMQRDASGSYGTLFDSYNATICEDDKWPSSPSTYESWAKRLGRRYPVFGGQFAYAAMVCAFWPKHSNEKFGLSNVKSPSLLVGATQDPATPYADTLRLHEELPGSSVLTRIGPGHTSYFASSCVRRAVDTFLVSLREPHPGTRCPSD
jgi:pimeloyl-ACP methyl ester carboxylesterase